MRQRTGAMFGLVLSSASVRATSFFRFGGKNFRNISGNPISAKTGNRTRVPSMRLQGTGSSLGRPLRAGKRATEALGNPAGVAGISSKEQRAAQRFLQSGYIFVRSLRPRSTGPPKNAISRRPSPPHPNAKPQHHLPLRPGRLERRLGCQAEVTPSSSRPRAGESRCAGLPILLQRLTSFLPASL